MSSCEERRTLTLLGWDDARRTGYGGIQLSCGIYCLKPDCFHQSSLVYWLVYIPLIRELLLTEIERIRAGFDSLVEKIFLSPGLTHAWIGLLFA
jgi:hypothetical protein